MTLDRLRLPKTTDCDPGPSVSPISPTDCPVCGAPAYAKHFSIVTCNACSAFFRRSVALNKQYFCKKGKRCMENGIFTKNLCKFCRFQRCVKVGMKLSSISKGGSPEQLSPSKSPLRSLMLCRKATFVNRIRATVDVYGGQENIKQMANLQVDPMAVTMALRAEFRVICEYLRTCGLMEDGLENISLEGLATSCLYTWMIYEGALNTVRNGGHQLNRVFFIDESYLPCNEDKVKEFYRGDLTVVDAESVARHGMDYFSEGLQLAHKFYKSRLDEAEQAALTQLFVIKTASDVTRSPELFASALSQVFENLKHHYVQNYDDVALKMGGIVLLLQELMHVRRLFDEHVIILKLNGKRTVLSEVEGPIAQSPAFVPKSEPASPMEMKHVPDHPPLERMEL